MELREPNEIEKLDRLISHIEEPIQIISFFKNMLNINPKTEASFKDGEILTDLFGVLKNLYLNERGAAFLQEKRARRIVLFFNSKSKLLFEKSMEIVLCGMALAESVLSKLSIKSNLNYFIRELFVKKVVM